MFKNLKEIRDKKKKGLYDLTLKINEDDYFDAFKEVNLDSAKDIIEKYLLDREDMGKAENIRIAHSKVEHSVNLTAELDYNDNY